MVNVAVGAGEWSEIISTTLDKSESTLLSFGGAKRGRYVIANGRGVAYGLFLLDEITTQYLLSSLPTISDPIIRAAAWISLWDAVLEGLIPVDSFLELTVRAIPIETDELILERVLGYLSPAYWRFLPEENRPGWAVRLEELLWSEMERVQGVSLKASFFRAFQSVALTPSALEKLYDLWEKELTVTGIPLSEKDYSTLAQELAVREVAGHEEILQEQLRRIEDTERRSRFEFVIPALSQQVETRTIFFESLGQRAKRQNEPWILEALRYLHHPLRSKESVQYLSRSLELLEEIKSTGTIFFPKRWLDASLWGHRSQKAVNILKDFLDARPDLPPRLRGKLLQSADGLFRSVRILEGSSPDRGRISSQEWQGPKIH
jgi:aminopeptidase N